MKSLPEQDEIYFFTYINESCAVLGRNQNLFQEVRLDILAEKGIQVARRISGGGTVYHDKGNLNLCWIAPRKLNWVNSYAIFMDPLIEYLKSFQCNAYLNDRNALFIDERKLCGTAQFTSGQRLLCHCTLLIESDLDLLTEVLATQKIHVESIASKSVRSKVMNLKDRLPDHTIQKTQNILHDVYSNKGFIPINERFSFLELPNEYLEKYSSFEWIYERSPTSHLRNKRLETLQIEQGILVNGDSKGNVSLQVEIEHCKEKKLTIDQSQNLFKIFFS